ncbi:hypothetical protein HK099_007050 [Clydaea vesicula]|uniref:Uncharacterized protein n=1 Tax=Clydaea vesicula TaxID=447962 RepID=A0AAD5TX65_9FUNG|nr:hypothetical protein HK099_007050 [Clydaea vesicula]
MSQQPTITTTQQRPAHLGTTSTSYVPNDSSIDRNLNSRISKEFIVFLILFTISFITSIVAFNAPDFLVTRKDPIFGISRSFGLFETCIKKGDDFSCYPFPGDKCRLPDRPDEEFTSCQTWLTARYLYIFAIVFGVLSMIGWFLSIFNYLRPKILLATAFTTTFFVGFQIVVMVLLVRLREDNTFFNVFGRYGSSFNLLTVGWVLGAVIILIFGVLAMVKRSVYDDLRNDPMGYLRI